MIATLNELMTLAETRNEKRKIAFGPLDLAKMAEKIQVTFREQAVKKGIAFTWTIPENLPPVQADAEMIEQLLENLVSNGIKYTPAGGSLGIFFSREHDTIEIKVQDTGIGIPKDALPRLFTEFFRAENARKIEEMGTGLGLAIIKDIVAQHQGRINVESEEGKGTTFFVLLPLVHKG